VLNTVTELARSVVTAGALQCQAAHATWIRAADVHLVLTVEGNRAAGRALAAQPRARCPLSGYTVLGHGRTETRSIKVISTGGQPGLKALFPHAACDLQDHPHTETQRKEAVAGNGLHHHLTGPPTNNAGATRRLRPRRVVDQERPALGA